MSDRVKIADLAPEQKRLLASPYGFAKFFLGLPVMDAAERRKVGECRDGDKVFYEIFDNDGQQRVLNALEQPGKVSVRTANGAGKTTTIIPGAALWCMALHPRAKVVATSGVERQVRAQMMPALHSRKARLEGWRFTDNSISAPNGSEFVGFATNEGGRFEGWHGNKDEFYDLLQHDGPLMIIVDEAKSVAGPIFDAIDRCTFQWLLLVSSCGGSAGQFYKSHTSEAGFYRTFQIGAGDCPFADHAKNLELILRRGVDDPLVLSKVFAEFMAGVEGAVIRREWVAALLASPPAALSGTRRIACDFAAGGDENVIADRNGNRVRVVAAWREKNTMQACGQFIDHFRRLGVSQENCPKLVYGDEGGLGKVILDRLAEMGWHINRCNNGAAANDKAAYRNWGAETWFEAARKIESKRVVIEGADDVLIGQLTERLGFTPSDGRRSVESKEDMRERGINSPDRADALCIAMREDEAGEPVQAMGGHDEDMGLLERMEIEGGRGIIPGAYAGD